MRPIMIISASRRTDIPAYHADGFMACIRAGSCEVPNPVNPRQVSCVSLAPTDVDAIVFWTRNPTPLLAHLDELDDRGYRYCFLQTMLDYPSILDPGMAPLDTRVSALQRLAEHIGPDRIAWRYDPIVLSNRTPVPFHIDTFGNLAGRLAGTTQRCITSFLDVYARIRPRLRALEEHGLVVRNHTPENAAELLPALVAIAREHGMTLQACAEAEDYTSLGVPPGACIDGAWIGQVLGVSVSERKDPGQRAACGCVVSRDIGQYDTCPAGCAYCYARKGRV
jgi:hypothetical protein